MSYAAPFSLVSFHLTDRDDVAEDRLTWPLAGSLAVHLVVFIALLGLRFASSLEQASGSYDVTLVTLPEMASSLTASPENASRPDRNPDKAPPPPPKAAEIPKAAEVPQRIPASSPEQTVSPPSPVPQENPSEPERVTESLMGALDSVVVPTPQAPALPQQSASARAPVLPAPPVRQTPAPEMDVQPIKAPPPVPELAQGPITGKPDTATTPDPSIDPLSEKLKQAVNTIVVPKKPKQASNRVMVASDGKPKRDRTGKDVTGTPRSSDIALPSRAPRLTAIAPPESPKKPMSRQTNSTVESLTKALQSVRVPKSISRSKPQESVSGAVPPVRESLPNRVPAKPAVSRTSPESDALERQIAKLEIPDSNVPPGFQHTESGSEETLELRVAGSSSKENTYWGKVRALIAGRWIVYRVEFQRSQPLQVVLAFRVEGNGRVTEPTVERSSGNRYFDRAAKRAVVAAVPLPPFPPDMRNPYYDVQYTFTGPRNR